MNAMFPPRLVRRLLLALIALSIVPLVAATACAAGPSVESASNFSTLQANFIFELVSDRARLIQVSLVFVATGCALIWWYR